MVIDVGPFRDTDSEGVEKINVGFVAMKVPSIFAMENSLLHMVVIQRYSQAFRWSRNVGVFTCHFDGRNGRKVASRRALIRLLEGPRVCAKVVVLLAKDTGRLPGNLVRDTTGKFVAIPGGDTSKIRALVV